MKTYKLFRVKGTKLYPLYVNAKEEIPFYKWIQSKPGELVDDTHVKASGCGGKLALRSGYHSTTIPFTDWIGEKQDDGTLAQRKDCVWCECEVKGDEVESKQGKVTELYPKIVGIISKPTQNRTNHGLYLIGLRWSEYLVMMK